MAFDRGFKLNIGDSGDQISELQNILAGGGFLQPGFKPGVVDQATFNAFRSFNGTASAGAQPQYDNNGQVTSFTFGPNTNDYLNVYTRASGDTSPGAGQGQGFGFDGKAPAESPYKSSGAGASPPVTATSGGQVTAQAQDVQSTNLSGGNFQQFQKNGTWFGYNQQTGQLIAFPNSQSLQKALGQPVNANAPQLPFDANHPAVKSALGNANQTVNISTGEVVQTESTGTGSSGGGGGSPSGPTGLPDKYKTGNPAIDGVLGQMYTYIQNNINSGKTLNPDLNIDANTIQQFINQAHSEIDPYYATVLGSIKDSLIQNLQDTAKSYNLQAKQEGETLKQNLLAERESAAGSGIAFSGVRGQNEEFLKESTQNTLDLDALRAASSAATSARQAEQQIGTSGVSGVAFPTIQPYSVSLEGEGGLTPGSAPSYFTPGSGSAGSVLGTLPAQQTSDVAQRVSQLKTDLLNTRNFKSLSAPAQ